MIDFDSIRTFLFDIIFGSLLVILAIYLFALRAKVRFLEREIETIKQQSAKTLEVNQSIAEIHRKLLDYFKRIFSTP